VLVQVKVVIMRVYCPCVYGDGETSQAV